jgi:hypothetical protein
MTDAQVNDIVVSEDILDDTSSTAVYELSIQLQNGRLTQKQREALHKMLVKFARQARISLMLSLPDKELSKVRLYRISSTTGRDDIEFFQE